ncbi:prevent-host-death family antitoxin [Neisseria macacae ATCC 33926]|uniref:Prevent-host-death family antitoxin n=1 Tax=Neisseria macacae ATCC 33926 TaxID=997348 RepID=A0AA36XLA5_9NEIS|nr:prevent-host-death family antitoxin [Neisseria macacae ATCC 33926]
MFSHICNKYGKGSSESVSDDPELIVNNTIHIVIIYFPDTVSPICKQFGLSLCFPL